MERKSTKPIITTLFKRDFNREQMDQIKEYLTVAKYCSSCSNSTALEAAIRFGEDLQTHVCLFTVYVDQTLLVGRFCRDGSIRFDK
ncbi:hypothetical protein KUCAC02_000609 [Chaenocephalus aceratus]|uniref:Uncharacterized protein n=1 Tax=Chaenocephalus aceratus TaxID=36190 RepID=A0ACB9W7V6_CHAAC|nr:hypothetical protein KUCAC02_000609 [Chaenocephalus aceratus]